MPSPARNLWALDPATTFLNHGSFGACPLAVLEHQRDWQRRLERDPVLFMIRELERELDAARAAVAGFVGADPEDLAFVPNATTGVNAVIASAALGPGDEVLVTSHGYAACTNAAHRWCERAGARVVTAELPFPLTSEAEVIEAVLARVSARTRLAVIDHVTSPTALVLPVAELARELRQRGVFSLIDGAHAPGMLALDVRGLEADYYAGNLHKWCCSPKGAAFLWARRSRQAGLMPVVTSHGAGLCRDDRSRFLLEFDWVGTTDPSAVLSVPFALRYLEGLVPGGWAEIRALNRSLLLEARESLLRDLNVGPPCPASMLGTMATLILPEARATGSAREVSVEPLYSRLYQRGIQVMLVPWPALPARLVRISAHLYNDRLDFAQLSQELQRALADERASPQESGDARARAR